MRENFSTIINHQFSTPPVMSPPTSLVSCPNRTFNNTETGTCESNQRDRHRCNYTTDVEGNACHFSEEERRCYTSDTQCRIQLRDPVPAVVQIALVNNDGRCPKGFDPINTLDECRSVYINRKTLAATDKDELTLESLNRGRPFANHFDDRFPGCFIHKSANNSHHIHYNTNRNPRRIDRNDSKVCVAKDFLLPPPTPPPPTPPPPAELAPTPPPPNPLSQFELDEGFEQPWDHGEYFELDEGFEQPWDHGEYFKQPWDPQIVKGGEIPESYEWDPAHRFESDLLKIHFVDSRLKIPRKIKAL